MVKCLINVYFHNACEWAAFSVSLNTCKCFCLHSNIDGFFTFQLRRNYSKEVQCESAACKLHFRLQQMSDEKSPVSIQTHALHLRCVQCVHCINEKRKQRNASACTGNHDWLLRSSIPIGWRLHSLREKSYAMNTCVSCVICVLAYFCFLLA